MDINNLKQLCSLPGPSGAEELPRAYLANKFKGKNLAVTYDRLGSVIGQTAENEHTVAIVSHLDEVGMIIKYIDESGLLYFDPIGSWWNQSMLNHPVDIMTDNQQLITGIIGSASPHALSPKQKESGIAINQMFIDVGANSKLQVDELGIAIGDFVVPHNQQMILGDKFVSKAVDNRSGCAVLTELEITPKDYQLALVGTVQEEVGLRGAQTSASLVKADITFTIDVTICGDTPNVDERDFQTVMNGGPSICIFDKRTIPNRKLLKYVKQIANQNNIPVQYYSMKTGATDGGRYNVMNGGSAVVSIAIPSRYIHAHNGMISLSDYEQTINLIQALIDNLDSNTINQITTFE